MKVIETEPESRHNLLIIWRNWTEFQSSVIFKEDLGKFRRVISGQTPQKWKNTMLDKTQRTDTIILSMQKSTFLEDHSVETHHIDRTTHFGIHMYINQHSLKT